MSFAVNVLELRKMTSPELCAIRRVSMGFGV